LGEEGVFVIWFWFFCRPLQTFLKCKIKTPQSVKHTEQEQMGAKHRKQAQTFKTK